MALECRPGDILEYRVDHKPDSVAVDLVTDSARTRPVG
jgi:hypothetical protein